MAPIGQKATKAKASQAKHKKTSSGGAGVDGGNALGRILLALAKLHSLGHDAPSRTLVANLANVPAGSSTMRNACAKLKKEHLADTSDPETLKLTDKGFEKVGPNVQPPTSNAEFQESFKDLIRSNGKTLEIFDILVSGEPRSRLELSKMIKVDMKKSTFRNAIAPLNKFDLLEELEEDKTTKKPKEEQRVKLADKCFPLGR